ncbi:hypothetical protein CI41S_54230 [Bradyrhizobium ivorense]|nr:hypothetical protein CI41S_54230 [Bradyrhizobium ivorense]
MPKKLFIGLDSPVPPSTRPLEKQLPKRDASFTLVELAAYQTSVFWHHAMNAVAPQTSPIAAIAWMAQRRSAGPSCGTWLLHAPTSPIRRRNAAG